MDGTTCRCKQCICTVSLDQKKVRATRCAKYRKVKRGEHNARNAKYKADKNQRTPKWLSNAQKQQIIQFYQDAAYLTNYTKIQMEVDHIIPLRGKVVSGLHVPWNLQLLTKQENTTKRNKFNQLPRK